MADRRVEFILEMRDNASLTINKLEKGIQDLTLQLKGVAVGSKEFRQLKTTIADAEAQMTKASNSSRSLAQSFKANWMAVSATILGVGYAAKKAFDMAGEGAKLEQTREVFKTQMNRMGMDAQVAFDKIKEAAGEMVDDSDIMRAANRATALGVPAEELADLMMLARQQARLMGIEVGEAFDRIAEGLGRVNPRMLAAVGIRIKGKDITKEEKEGVTELTDAMGSEVDMLALLDKLHKNYIDTIDEENLKNLTAAERHQVLRARMKEMHDQAAMIFSRVLSLGVGVADVLGGSFDFLLGAIFNGAAMIEEVMNDVGLSTSTKWQERAKAASEATKDLFKKAGEAFSLSVAPLDRLSGSAGILPKKVAEAFDGSKPSIKGFTAAIEDLQKQMSKYSPNTEEYKALAKQMVDLAEKSIAYEKTTVGLNDKLKTLKDEFEKMDPTTGKAQLKFNELTEASKRLEIQMEKLDLRSRGLNQTHFTMQNIKASAALDGFSRMYQSILANFDQSKLGDVGKMMSKTIESGMAGIGKPIKVGLSFKPTFIDQAKTESYYAEQMKLIEELGTAQIQYSLDERLSLLKNWESNAIKVAKDNEALKTQITRVATEERAAINAEKYQQMADVALQSLQMISTFMSQQSEAQIGRLQKEADARQKVLDKSERDELKKLDLDSKARLKNIDKELQRDNLSATRKKQLTAERAAFEEQAAAQQAEVQERYAAQREADQIESDRKIAEAKKRAFETNKAAAIIDSIINTALAVTKVWGQAGIFGAPMAAVVGVLGAAQTALIAAQPVPEFHTGSGDRTIGEVLGRGAEDEFPIVVKGSEMIYTKEQERRRGAGGNTLNISVNNYGTIADERAMQKIINKMMRQLNTTDVGRVFVNNHSRIEI